MGVIRAYPFIARHRRPLTHKHHFLLQLFSKNFVFLNQIGYATALSCYFGYKLCVIKVGAFWRNKLFSLPLLGGFSLVRKWLVVGLLIKTFRSCWLRFLAYAVTLGWHKTCRCSWVSGGLAVLPSSFSTTVPWRLVSHRFWKKSSLGNWSILPFKKNLANKIEQNEKNI